jgi:hypothetical protein
MAGKQRGNRASKSRASRRKASAPRKPGRHKRAAAGKAPSRKARRRAPGPKKAAGRKAPKRKSKRAAVSRRARGRADSDVTMATSIRGLGPETGGQSGDTEGLSRAGFADSESVEELLEEGQAFEAGIVSGVENASDPDQSEVRTREVPEDDVPQEYLDED